MNELILKITKMETDADGTIRVRGFAVPPPSLLPQGTEIPYSPAYLIRDLITAFQHMKCWNVNDGVNCEACPVLYNGLCAIQGIRDNALKQGLILPLSQPAQEGRQP